MRAPANYLEQAMDRYPPPVAATARAALKKLRKRFPGATLSVYDRRGSLPLGFAPAAGGSPVLSIVIYPRWVRFFFLEGIGLDDPERRLEGTGKQVRSLRLDDGATVLEDPYVQGLLEQAARLADADLKTGPGRIVLKSTLPS
jgi:hypothetical protein